MAYNDQLYAGLDRTINKAQKMKDSNNMSNTTNRLAYERKRGMVSID